MPFETLVPTTPETSDSERFEAKKKEYEAEREELQSFCRENDIAILIKEVIPPSMEDLRAFDELKGKIEKVRSKDARDHLENMIAYLEFPIIEDALLRVNGDIALERTKLERTLGRLAADKKLSPEESKKYKRYFESVMNNRLRGNQWFGKWAQYEVMHNDRDRSPSLATEKIAKTMQDLLLVNGRMDGYNDLTSDEKKDFHTKVFPQFVTSLASDVIKYER